MSDVFFAKAMQTITTRHQKAETIALQAEQAVLQTLPALETIRQHRRTAGMQAATLALEGAPQAEIDLALNKANQYKQEEDALLLNNGIDPNSLLPQFQCKLCNDTGNIQGKNCICVKTLANEYRAQTVNEAFPFPLYRFETFDTNLYSEEILPDTKNQSARSKMSAVFNYCKNYANAFDLDNGSLFLYGRAGIGKTHLALSIASCVREKGYVVVYASAQSVFAKIESEKFNNGGQTLQTMLDAQLLILDDLGTEYITPYISSCLYNIINTRSVAHLPTIYTSNIITPQDLARRYTEKVASRLLGECDRLYCVGEDIRLQGKK